MKPSSLFSQASWSLTGQIGYYGLQWLNMILLARLSGPEAVGLYTLGLAIANPIMAMASLMLRMVYITDQENRWSFDQYRSVRRIMLPIGIVVIGAVALGLGYRDVTLIVILLAASWKTAETLSDINYAIPHKSGNMRAIALSMIIRAGLSTVLLALVLSLSGRLDISLLTFALSWWLCYFLNDRKFADHAEAKQTDNDTLSLVRFSLPMALSAAVIYLTFSVPRVVLDQFEDTATLGIFAAIGHLLLIGTMVVNALGSAITPRLSRFFAAREMRNYYREIILGVALSASIATGFIVVAYFAGDIIITLIYGEAIGGQGDLVLAIALASLPIYIGSFIGFVPPALQAYRFHLTINIITVIGTTAATFAFIPTLGALGAIYAIVIQGVLQLLNFLILLRRPDDKPYEATQETAPSAS